ncbi:MAG: phospholipid/cholesterol/gamma-HCH transport system substrate-binding protein, partial [Thermoleophilaceae bacterium]|nr:phospholipid/cholesterol/gamma-HCH transport system substrate-binding protein [Thermoleophilaceae bacterium]
MPTRRGARRAARALTVAVIALAVVLVALFLFAKGGNGYAVTLALDNASQLVKGNQVKVGGVPVGSVSKLDLGPEGRAHVEISIDDDSVLPLHEGTRAEVRSSSLAGVANRYVALTPGPENRPEIDRSTPIPADDTTSEVDLDALLNTLDPHALGDLRTFVRGSADALDGRGRQLGRAIDALNPALSQIDAVERELLQDQGRFARFLVESADVVSAVAPRRAQLERLVASGHSTLDEIAAHDVQVDSLLRRLPPTLRTTNTTLVNLRVALRDLDPTVRLARPVAAPLAETLDRLRPVARDARPVVARLRQTIDRSGGGDLIGVLQRMPALERSAVPALDSTKATVDDLLPILDEVRPYTPDLVGGNFNGFGGTTGGYYDANGHYTRISMQSSVYSLNNLGSLLPTPPALGGITGYRRDVH